jgi:5'(3')-deoxyribonucleotidase
MKKNKRRLTILVDIDDVLNNLLERWVDTLNDRYETNVRAEDVKTWDIHTAFPSLDVWNVYEPLEEHSFWRGMEVKPGSEEGIKRLLFEDGHVVKIVTATNYSVARTKIEWLLDIFPFYSEDVIIAYKKQMIRGDVLVDNAVHNLEGGSYEKLLFTSPPNQSYDAGANGMRRVNNWEEVCVEIEKIAKKRR